MVEILVVGATGQQGGGVIDALLTYSSNERIIAIRALTRNPSSAKAIRVRDKGARLITGDLSDRQSMQRALSGCNAAYLVTDFRNPGGIQTEISSGKAFIDVAYDVGVKHVVFSSVAGADKTKGAVDHFHSKFVIEEHLRLRFSDADRSWTIIRPAGFLDVIPSPGLPRMVFMSAMFALLGNNIRLPYISCKDIGKACAKALLEPTRMNGHIIHLAAEALTTGELRDALDRANGGTTWTIWMPRWFVLQLCPYDYKQMFQWLRLGEQPSDMAQTRDLLPDVLTAFKWESLQKAQRY